MESTPLFSSENYQSLSLMLSTSLPEFLSVSLSMIKCFNSFHSSSIESLKMWVVVTVSCLLNIVRSLKRQEAMLK